MDLRAKRTRWAFRLRTKVIGIITALLVVMMICGGLIVNCQFSEQLKDQFKELGSVMTRSMASTSVPNLLYQGQESKQLDYIKNVMAEYQDIQYILVLKLDETGAPTIMTAWPPSPTPQDTRILNHINPLKRGYREAGDLFAFTEPVVRNKIMSATDDLVTPEELDGEADSEVLGYICMGISTAKLDTQTNQALSVVALVLTILTLSFVGITFYYLTSNLTQRLGKIRRTASRISSGDLTDIISDEVLDEIGELALALNQISSNLNDIMSAISTVSDSLADAVEQITSHTEEVVQGAEHQVTTVDETSSSMAQMLISLKGIAENVEILASSAEESSSSILEMAATNDEMADNIHSLAASVEQTTTSIGQMTQTVKEVARNVEDLSATADETSASMREMDVTISQVETNANQTADLSEEVRRDAERGADAVKMTMQGISRINESTQDAFQVMGNLGKKVQAIGQVLTVIDDVAEQTNLLALNAAIIAAQAGDHGKGFAVVADEIKDLAERTAASTSEIVTLIQAVQSETKNVIDAMQRGLKNVENGVRLSTEAEAALRKILDSATKSTQMVREIARATVEQARGSKEVTSSISRIAETVQQIATATAEQAKGSEQIMNSAERMRIITQHVHGSSQEQARGSKQITRAIGNISEMVNHLNRAQREQARGAEQVMKAVERIKEIAERHSQAMVNMKNTVDLVASQADTLRAKMSRLKL